MKSVAIVGAGCSGLVAVKTCLEEGLNPVCFESSADIGGLWRFTHDVIENRGCVMSTTVINTSKEMTAYSDFPPPREFPNFMAHSKVLQYFRLYAERHQLTRFIRFNTEVETITPISQQRPHSHSSKCSEVKTSTRRTEGIADERSTPAGVTPEDIVHLPTKDVDKRSEGPGWTVVVRDKAQDVTSCHRFDAVLICIGHHARVNMPDIPGQDTFQGRLVHSRDVRHVASVEGAKNVVVGVGNSGCDLAVELSRRAKVLLSTRRGAWLMQRLQTGGLPVDFVRINRLVFATAFSLPTAVLNRLVARNLNQKLDHDLYGLRPQHGPISAHPTVNDELPNRIISGQVIIKPGVGRLAGSDVHFTDGTIEKDVDNVILATGYRIDFPFLDPLVLSCHDNQTKLYLHMFPANGHCSSLAVIGCVQPGGALGPVAEMQCRLAVKVFLGKVTLPNQESMKRDIQRKEEITARRYVATPRHTVQVDYIPYMDELAQIIGCKPNFVSLILRDPKLAFHCFFGPCTSYQYRLQGPGMWPGAREAILTQMDRVKYPFTATTTAPPRSWPSAGSNTSYNVCKHWGSLLPLFLVVVVSLLVVLTFQ